jgi:hypothetical protein
VGASDVVDDKKEARTLAQEGSPATRAKNKYRDKTYDRMELVVPKGKKAEFQAHAECRGESLNGFINRAADETMERDKGDKNN